MARHPISIRPPGVALALLAVLALSGCARERACTAEVIEGAGIFKGTASGSQSDQALRQEAIRIACGQLCASRGPVTSPGCVGRCAVDTESAKIGLRASCTGGSAR